MSNSRARGNGSREVGGRIDRARDEVDNGVAGVIDNGRSGETGGGAVEIKSNRRLNADLFSDGNPPNSLLNQLIIVIARLHEFGRLLRFMISCRSVIASG